MMWSYYGSKSKVIDFYPPPKYGKIIEPFAGTARYSLKWFDRDILLVDKYPVIIEVWNYLKEASPADIMQLPEPKYHESLDDYKLSNGERYLLGFLANRGNGTPCKLINNYSDITGAKKIIANQLFKIRHWVIRQGSYDDIVNQEATWFIDPPYQIGGHKYHEHKINFKSLGEWCKSRSGQIIVCENTKAKWMPFLPMIDMKGCAFKTTEAIWSNMETNYEYQQQSLF